MDNVSIAFIMETAKFNFEARRREWPLIEKVMGYFSGHTVIDLLKASSASTRTGPAIKLYNQNREVFGATVGFGLYAPTYRFDALHILLQYMHEMNITVEWDAVSFSGNPETIARNSGRPLLNPDTSDIAHYANIGLRASFAEISNLPASSKIHHVFNAFLGNTAIVTLKTKPLTHKELEELMLGTIADVLRPSVEP